MSAAAAAAEARGWERSVSSGALSSRTTALKPRRPAGLAHPASRNEVEPRLPSSAETPTGAAHHKPQMRIRELGPYRPY